LTTFDLLRIMRYWTDTLIPSWWRVRPYETRQPAWTISRHALVPTWCKGKPL